MIIGVEQLVLLDGRDDENLNGRILCIRISIGIGIYCATIANDSSKVKQAS